MPHVLALWGADLTFSLVQVQPLSRCEAQVAIPAHHVSHGCPTCPDPLQGLLGAKNYYSLHKGTVP